MLTLQQRNINRDNSVIIILDHFIYKNWRVFHNQYIMYWL